MSSPPVQKSKDSESVEQERTLETGSSNFVQKGAGAPPGESAPPLTLKWRRGKSMPLEMGSTVSSVVVNDALYVGGGWTENGDGRRVVLKLDLQQEQWSKLPEYFADCFAMTSVDDQLVLVGGRDQYRYKPTSLIAVFESGKWMHPYPPMSIPRHSSTAVSLYGYIVVIGGENAEDRQVSLVEVLDLMSRSWYTAQSLPLVRTEMKSTLVNSTLFIMGGRATFSTTSVYCVDLDFLIPYALEGKDTPTLWEKIEDTPLLYSTPLGIGKSLLALGGVVEFGNRSSSIHLYQPDSRRWVKVGDLPTAMYNCTCSVLPSGEVIIAGGQIKSLEFFSNVDYLTIEAAH